MQQSPPAWIPIRDALAAIAERLGVELSEVAERFRAAAYDGQIEVRARPNLFADDKAIISREAFAAWRASFVDERPYGVGFHFGPRARWCDQEVRSGDVDRLWPPRRRSPPGRRPDTRNRVEAMRDAIRSGRFSAASLRAMTKVALAAEFGTTPETAYRALSKNLKSAKD